MFGKLLAGTLGGAAIGGLYGASGGGGMGGAIGGAVMGGAFGGAGFRAARRFGAARGMSIAGGMRRGLESGIRGARWGRGKLTGVAARSLVGGAGYGGVAAGYGADLTRAAGMGMATARGAIGRNATAVNKYGGMALGAIGTASAAHIGSSIMASNRGY